MFPAAAFFLAVFFCCLDKGTGQAFSTSWPSPLQQRLEWGFGLAARRPLLQHEAKGGAVCTGSQVPWHAPHTHCPWNLWRERLSSCGYDQKGHLGSLETFQSQDTFTTTIGRFLGCDRRWFCWEDIYLQFRRVLAGSKGTRLNRELRHTWTPWRFSRGFPTSQKNLGLGSTYSKKHIWWKGKMLSGAAACSQLLIFFGGGGPP